ncbi:MAG: hypothetical protein ACRESK_09395 [Gammaproteobacteria bacterium]
MSDNKDGKTLEDYLKGGSDLSRRYQAGGQAEPPAHLDADILRAAHAAETKKTGTHTRNWYVPLSLAAVVVIGVSLVFRMYEYKGQTLLSEPKPAVLMDKQSDHDVTEDSSLTKPEEAPALSAPAPQTLPQKMERDNLQGEMLREELIEENVKMRALGQSPAGAAVYSEKELAQPEAQMSPLVVPEADMSLREKKSTLDIQATTAAAESRVLSETEWLKNISQLWESGKKDEAVASFKQFLTTYPQYSHAEIIKQLPEDFDPEKYISGFDKNQE